MDIGTTEKERHIRLPLREPVPEKTDPTPAEPSREPAAPVEDPVPA